MPAHTWIVPVEGIDHSVVAVRSEITGAFGALVDGHKVAVAEIGSGQNAGHVFSMDGHPAIIRTYATAQEIIHLLFVDGVAAPGNPALPPSSSSRRRLPAAEVISAPMTAIDQDDEPDAPSFMDAVSTPATLCAAASTRLVHSIRRNYLSASIAACAVAVTTPWIMLLLLVR